MKVYILTKTDSQFLGRAFTLNSVLSIYYNIATQRLEIKRDGGLKELNYHIYDIEIIEISEGGGLRKYVNAEMS